MNTKLGHSPLPVKLRVRQYLQTCEYDRKKPTYDTFRQVIGHVINLEDSLRVGGKYPWQPNTYEEANPEYERVQSFYQDMRKEEEEFLALPPAERQGWIKDFKWRW
jgi:hypothetical protein